jgi:heme exporter protein C
LTAPTSASTAAARAAAPLGAAFTFLALFTGSLWGRPMWGTWWEWGDARIVSVLVLFLLFLGYMALLAAIDDEAKATRAANILAMVGVVNLPIIKFSVNWWNTLHQGSSLFAGEGKGLAPVYVPPFLLTLGGFAFLFGALWLVRVRGEVWRRKAGALAVQAAGKA